ncbi:hypothetical protein [Neorhizobium alkalisoli]|uniref:hypothetical protein n=1 Tax=Neorhizobium alkalisoli TaxID=528178 RepID=UPI000CF93108|nr:hypothetical protein [Neorhizobium alkalisoli]
MTASSRERQLWWFCLLSLPFLLTGAFAVNAWRNVGDYVHRIERIRPGDGNEPFAGATWRLETARLIGNGRDTKVTFPGQMRLVIVRLVASAAAEIGEGWSQCQLTLNDDKGRRWLPLDFALSNSISRDLDPKVKPVDGCGAASRNPPAVDGAVLIEEKFVVPAEATHSLSVHLSFSATRPDAISFPLGLK